MIFFIKKIKALIPLSFKIKLRSLLGYKPLPNITFEGVYPHLNDVVESNNGYDNADWLRKYKEATIEKYNHYLSKQIASEPLTPIYNLMTLSLALISVNNKKIKVLDFGGGFGTNYIDCLNSLGSKKEINYNIVERPSTIELAQDLPFTKAISFYETLPNLTGLDLIYAGSVLQYIDNYQDLLIKFCGLNPAYIFLTNHFLGTRQTFATKQVNMINKTIGYWIINKEEIVTLMSNNGYTLIHQSVNFQPFHDMKNFESEYQVNDTSNLIFAKNT